MADQAANSNDPVDRLASPLRTKIIRSQKISASSPTEAGASASSPASVSSSRDVISTEPVPAIPRTHTPGHLASKSSTARPRRNPSHPELSIRQRAATAGASAPTSSSQNSSPKGPPVSIRNTGTLESGDQSSPEARPRRGSPVSRDGGGGSSRRPAALRSTSAIASKAGPPTASTAPPASTDSDTTTNTNLTTTGKSAHAHTPAAPARATTRASGGGSSASKRISNTTSVYTPFPPLASPTSGPDVPPAPSSGMYWSKAPVSGHGHPALRAHTTTIIGSNIYVFGGCDSRACFNELYVLDADAFHWSRPYVSGDIPVPLRAMTCTAVGKKLVIFGGGDGPAYYNDVYVLDTVNFRWTKPKISGDRVPSKRRAHTSCLHKNGIYVFGGGDGVRALNDIWRLDVGDLSKMSWKLVSSPSESPATATPSPQSAGKNNANNTSSSNTPSAASAIGVGSGKNLRPKARGYHTANIVDGKLIIFGGSDGGECFNDVWVYDIETHVWKAAPVSGAFRRLSHTATIVGSYLFVIGGHDGNEYSNDVLLLNMVQMTWDKRKVYGLPPSGRGYHGTVLHDSRLLTIGGFDGGEVFGDVWILEMAVHSYYSQISHFQIEV
ncbi:unnamed protein product [Discula destructiva]